MKQNNEAELFPKSFSFGYYIPKPYWSLYLARILTALQCDAVLSHPSQTWDLLRDRGSSFKGSWPHRF